MLAAGSAAERQYLEGNSAGLKYTESRYRGCAWDKGERVTHNILSMEKR